MTERITYTEFFPYPEPRKGQDEMMASIEDAVRNGTHICAEAPNGFGKTCATLSGAMPWVRENNGKILYCARTHRQLDRVMEELETISERNEVTGVSFRGRRHMCINQFVLENADLVAPISEVCSQLKTNRKCSYYEKLRDSGLPEDLLEDMPKSVLTAPELVDIGKRRSICPYELAKSLAKVVDVVALSYLYVFDPWILETFLPDLETPMSRMILVQDEAHNVPQTALNSASDSLAIGTVRRAIQEAKTYSDSISKDYSESLERNVLNLSSDMKDNDENAIDPYVIYKLALEDSDMGMELDALGHMEDLGIKIRRSLLRAGKFPRSAIHRVADFMQKWANLGERDDYAFMLTSTRKFKESKRISLDLVALDPTTVTAPILNFVHSSIAVSGTISPLDAYSEMLGFDEGSIRKSFHNPFAMRNRLCLVVDGVDTSFQGRSDAMFSRFVDHCVAVAHATPGNTGIFTTSYSVAKSLLKAGL
ncbi:MAG: hypothetical protein ACFFB7_06465, partial [Candidatus Sifarchaeia archaeon]